MLQKPNVPVIALEEHYADGELYALFTGLDAATPPHVVEKLKDTGAARLKDMDAAGIDVQVLSHSAPSRHRSFSDRAGRFRRWPWLSFCLRWGSSSTKNWGSPALRFVNGRSG